MSTAVEHLDKTAIEFRDKSAATLETMEKVWRTARKSGKLVRRDAGSFDPALKPLAAAMGGKTGPITYPGKGTSLGPMYSKNKHGVFAISGNTKKTIDTSAILQGKKPLRSNARSNRSVNAVVNNHEGNEAQLFRKKVPATAAGMRVGHHSISNVIGREHNTLVKGDSKLRAAIPSMRRARVDLEGASMKELMPVGVNGKQMPFEYGKSPRLNRRMIRAMYDKEIGIPLNTTKKNRHAILKATGKAERDS